MWDLQLILTFCWKDGRPYWASRSIWQNGLAWSNFTWNSCQYRLLPELFQVTCIRWQNDYMPSDFFDHTISLRVELFSIETTRIALNIYLNFAKVWWWKFLWKVEIIWVVPCTNLLFDLWRNGIYCLDIAA